MRLTLRTLLAYMDDILEPADHEELGKKIESSDFATELIHRSRDTVRRLRLGAPDVFAEDSDDVLDSSSTADANVVAEYLDNTLPSEAVVEFERLCVESSLEADMHLAEVASCHHVLTMVLGEPAEIEGTVRQRMYKLPEKLAGGQQLRIEQGHASSAASPDQPPLPPQTVTTTEPPPAQSGEPSAPVEPSTSELPDYLRSAANAQRRTRRWIWAAALLVVVGGIVGYFVSGEFKEVELLAEMDQDELLAIEEGLTIEGVDDGFTMESADPAGDPTSEAPAFQPSDPTAVDEAPSLEAAAPVFSPPVPVDPEESQAPAFVAPPVDSISEESDLSTKVDADPLTADADLTGEKEESGTALEPTDPTDQPPLLVAAADPTAPTIDTDLTIDPGVPEQQGPARLGSYLGNSDVLLRHDGDSGKWIRLSPQSPISRGDRLLALPKFRTHISLADMNIRLSGGTQIKLPPQTPPTDGEADLELEVVYGRLLLVAGLKGNRVSFQIGDKVRQVHLGDSANLAVEVHRVFVPGSNYEQEASPIEAVWYLTTGSVDWLEAAGDEQTIEAPAMWQTTNGAEELPKLIEHLPDWVDREPVTDLERRARDTLAEELEPGQPVGLRLLELNDQQGRGRRREVRTLAAESSVYVGEFEPFVKALNDVDQRRAWNSHIRTLREAMAMSPDVALRVHETFVNLRGEDAASDLMEMVRGYSQEAVGTTRETIMDGVLVKLIGWLDKESLDYRVLAIHSLNEITGTSYLAGYQPEQSSSQRQRALRKLRERLESNELLPKP